jgi:hypothetical protein
VAGDVGARAFALRLEFDAHYRASATKAAVVAFLIGVALTAR